MKTPSGTRLHWGERTQLGNPETLLTNAKETGTGWETGSEVDFSQGVNPAHITQEVSLLGL